MSADAGLLPTTSAIDIGWVMSALRHATLVLGALLGKGLSALSGAVEAHEDDL